MRNYNLGALSHWRPLGVGEVLDIEMPEIGYRSVAFDIMAAGTVAVNVVSGEDYWLVGYGEGEISVKFSIDRPVGVVVVGDAATDVFIRTFTDAPTIPESLEVSYTTIEPRPAGPSEDLRKMMHIVNLNQQRRDAAMQAERDAMMAEIRRLQQGTQTNAPSDPEPVVAPPAGAEDSQAQSGG